MIMLERDGSLCRDERADARAASFGARWEQLTRRAGVMIAQVRDGVDRGHPFIQPCGMAFRC